MNIRDETNCKFRVNLHEHTLCGVLLYRKKLAASQREPVSCIIHPLSTGDRGGCYVPPPAECSGSVPGCGI